jgi:hypothetical protein
VLIGHLAALLAEAAARPRAGADGQAGADEPSA